MNAQSYNTLWQEADNLSKKDHPRSLIKVYKQIEDKAIKEKQMPQLLKAYLSRLQVQKAISPDSTENPLPLLEKWKKESKSALDKAVLNFIQGAYIGQLGIGRTPFEKIRPYFKQALEDKDLLRKTSATTYTPLSCSQKLSQVFLEDNFLDLLVKQIIYHTLHFGNQKRIERLKECTGYYDMLIQYYDAQNDKEKADFTRYIKQDFLYNEDEFLLEKNPQNTIAYIQWLTDMYTQYKGKSMGFILADKLIDRYINQGVYTSAMQYIEESLQFSPSEEYKKRFLYQKSIITTPYIQAVVEYGYPQTKGKITLWHKNIQQVSLHWYKLPYDAVTIEKLRRQGTQEIEKIVKQLQPIVYTFHLTPPTDYKTKVSKEDFVYPEAGHYWVKTVVDGVEIESENQLLSLSPYTFIEQPIDPKMKIMEYTLIDQGSGIPITHAPWVLYDADSIKEIASSVPTKQGTLAYIWNKKEDTLLAQIKDGTNSTNLQTISAPYNYYSDDDKEDKEEIIEIYTDRGVYRPGQTVHVTGIAFYAIDDIRKVNTDRTFTLSFRDTNHKELEKKSITTDEFGAFSTTFSIPKDVLNGTFTIRCDDGRASIQVEEYKLPTFEVALTPYEGSYTWGDSIKITGKAMLLSSAPVREGRVSYKIHQEHIPMWSYYDREGFCQTLLKEGTTKTNADGTFQVPIIFPTKEKDRGRRTRGTRYALEVTVTDIAGESHQISEVYYIGKYAYSPQIRRLPATINKENIPTSITLGNYNLSDVLVKNTTIVWEIRKTVKKTPEKTPFPYFEEDLSETGSEENPIKGDLVLQGEISSGDSIDTLILKGLPSGEYTLWAYTKDEQENFVEARFVLFSPKDKKSPVNEPLWVYSQQSTFSETQPIEYQLGVQEKDAYIFCYVYSAGKRVESTVIRLSQEMKSFRLPYKKEYGKAVRIIWGFMKQGQWYQKEKVYTYVVPEKQLKLKWETFRDKLRPGDKEEWILSIADKDGKPVDARMLATMYDSALDAIRPYSWKFSLQYPRYTPYVRIDANLTSPIEIYWKKTLEKVHSPYSFHRLLSYSYLELPLYHEEYDLDLFQNYDDPPGILTVPMAMVGPKVTRAPLRAKMTEDSMEEATDEGEEESTSTDNKSMLRTNFSENAFFSPQLRTDAQGRVKIAFTMPESLTRWKFQALAHTKDMDYGKLESFITTSKEFMVQPNLPRFLRVGDKGNIAASLVNLSDKSIQGKATLSLIDPATDKVLHTAIADFHVAENGTSSISFPCDTQEDWGGVVICKITAEGNNFSDGEQRFLPILSNKQWVMETRPFQIIGEGKETINIEGIFGEEPQTAQHKHLTVELAANAGWYAIQSLPLSAAHRGDDVFSWTASYFGNAISQKILKEQPKLRTTLEAWSLSPTDKEQWWSKLEQNPELKEIALEQSPWLQEAKNESSRQRALADFFQENHLRLQQDKALRSILALQQTDGSFSWFPGMKGNHTATLQVCLLVARLQYLGADMEEDLSSAYKKAIQYIERELKEDYLQELADNKKRGNNPLYVPEQVLNFLYISAIDPQVRAQADQKMVQYYLQKIQKQSSPFTIYGKANIAIIMQAYGLEKKATELLRSIEEYSVYRPDMGRYFDTAKALYGWRSYKLPTQIAALEAIHRLKNDPKTVGEMQLWLLKQKQVQSWGDPVVTAEAIYALLLGNSTLTAQGSMQAHWDDKVVSSSHNPLGYTKESFTTAPSDDKIIIEKTGESTGWGAVFAQYQTTIDKVQATQGEGIQINREYLKDGIAITPETQLHIGDKITVKITLTVDRDMDFVQVKDRKPACIEPLIKTSGYTWEGGIGFYRSIKDSELHFFMDYVRKGTYTISYTAHIDRTGTYQAGSAVAQAAYAPEFGSHTAGIALKVAE